MCRCVQRVKFLGIVVALILAVTETSAVAQCELAEVFANDGADLGAFGNAVAIGGDYLVAGAPSNLGADRRGSAYVFRRMGGQWLLDAKLTASDVARRDDFGDAVSISGNRVVVGASGAVIPPPNGNLKGAAYVFRHFHGAWHEEAKLTVSDYPRTNHFGLFVSLSGECVLIGSPTQTDEFLAQGAVFVFRQEGTSWIREATLTPSDPSVRQRFGRVSLSGEYALVGAPGDDAGGEDAGAAYVFKRTGTTWVEEAKLTAIDAAPNDEFGVAVALHDDLAVVGADCDGACSGSAYVYRRQGTTWVYEGKLTASDGEATEFFGAAVAAGDDLVLAGARYADGLTESCGAAYAFQWNGTTWSEQAKLVGANTETNDHFGWAVSTYGNLGLVGALTAEGIVEQSGAAYVFGIAGDCNANDLLDPCEVAEGLTEDCSGDGIPDECDPDCNGNGEPDTCDVFEGTSTDCDHDGILDECELDNDADGDGVEDCVDGCPNDPDKMQPGQCDCGYPEDDADGDGTADCLDPCRYDPDKVDPGVCGCGVPDEDSDGDGILDCAAHIALVPVGADGPHVLAGNDIVVSSSGQTVTLEIQVANWDPHLLGIYQAVIDMHGFLSGDTGTAFPLGWDRPFEPVPCNTDADCPPEWPHCYQFVGPMCGGPDYDPARGAFIDTPHPDYVYAGITDLPGVDYVQYRFGNLAFDDEDAPAYVPPPKYAGTLILELSADAAGTFVIGVVEDRLYTFLRNPEEDLIVPLTFAPARIIIQPPTCGNGECELGEDEESCPEDCTEQPVCGNDVCEPGEHEESCPADCAEPPIDGIPTLSTWGVLILTILLLVGGKVYHSRRHPMERRS